MKQHVLLIPMILLISACATTRAPSLNMLEKEDAKKATLVNLRYFGGFTNMQAAEQLGISTATADRYWTFAKAWLRSKMES